MALLYSCFSILDASVFAGKFFIVPVVPCRQASASQGGKGLFVSLDGGNEPDV